MSLQSLDKFVNKFSRKVDKLRKYEYREEQRKDHRRLFDELLEVLIKRRQYAKDQDLWKELYLRSIHFYKNETIGRIPTTLVTKHNEILPFYMQQGIHKNAGTLVHFDTHLDENGVKGSTRLPWLYGKYLETRDSRYIKEAQELVWDIGAANSGVLFTTGVRDVVWCLPRWVPEKDIKISYFIKEGKTTSKLGTTDNIRRISHMDEFTMYKSKPFATKSAHYTRLQMGTVRISQLKALEDAILANGPTYILDIDLDYLVCNGKPLQLASYHRESYDVQSFHRTQYREFNETLPRNKNEDTRELRKYASELHTELGKIKKRIRTLIRIVKYLKKRGMTPSHISICDSTNINFSECESCNSASNNYVPHNLALYVHTKVMKGLKALFK